MLYWRKWMRYISKICLQGAAIMADYQKMYYILCRAMDKALDMLPDGEARQILQRAMEEAEEKYIDTAGEQD